MKIFRWSQACIMELGRVHELRKDFIKMKKIMLKSVKIKYVAYDMHIFTNLFSMLGGKVRKCSRRKIKIMNYTFQKLNDFKKNWKREKRKRLKNEKVVQIQIQK